jgi:hypothetical protein
VGKFNVLANSHDCDLCYLETIESRNQRMVVVRNESDEIAVVGCGLQCAAKSARIAFV